MSEFNIEQAIGTYIRIRDARDELRKKQAEEIKRFNDALYKIETRLLQALDEDGLESARSDTGTAFRTVRTSAKVVDWDTFLDHVIKNELWQMLERRAAKTSVEEYVEQVGDAPPGIEIEREQRVNVRRPT